MERKTFFRLGLDSFQIQGPGQTDGPLNNTRSLEFPLSIPTQHYTDPSSNRRSRTEYYTIFSIVQFIRRNRIVPRPTP